MRYSRIVPVLLATMTVALSSIAEGGIIRMAGSTSSVAPAVVGNTHLVATTHGIGDPLPAVADNYIFHNGNAPHIQVDNVGASMCDWAFETCWGEYVPGELLELQGAIWGGHPTAILSYHVNIIDSFGTIVHTFLDTDPETTTEPFYVDHTVPGNPCVGTPFYGNDIPCQPFSLSVEIPSDLIAGEWYDAQWYAAYTAPVGMHFATNAIDGGPIDELRTELFSLSVPMPIMKRWEVSEAPAVLLVLFGAAGILASHRRRKKA